jgi:hypothetical protein
MHLFSSVHSGQLHDAHYQMTLRRNLALFTLVFNVIHDLQCGIRNSRSCNVQFIDNVSRRATAIASNCLIDSSITQECRIFSSSFKICTSAAEAMYSLFTYYSTEKRNHKAAQTSLVFNSAEKTKTYQRQPAFQRSQFHEKTENSLTEEHESQRNTNLGQKLHKLLCCTGNHSPVEV